MLENAVLPKPDSSRAGFGKSVFWAVFALTALAAALWWVTRDAGERTQLRDQAAELINRGLNSTPLAGIGDVIRGTPTPPPPAVFTPPTEKGTLAGREVSATVGAPINLGSVPEGSSAASSTTPELALGSEAGVPYSTQAEQPMFTSEPLPPTTEDSKIKPTYLREVANWIVGRYKPGPKGGTLAVNVQSLNSLLGTTIAYQTGGRSSLLRYTLQPSMVSGLYNLYINRFMDDLDAAAQHRGFSANDNRQFHLALAGRALLIASALEGVMEVSDLAGKMDRIEDLAQKAVELNAQLANAIFALDSLREGKAPRQEIKAAQLRVDGITARYQRAMDEHADAQQALTGAIRKKTGQSLDEDSLLFMAAWVQRRLNDTGDAGAVLKTGANIFRDLARRCAERGQQS